MSGPLSSSFNAAASPDTSTSDKSGLKIWRNEQGQYHRTDGPAIERADGTTEWFVNGLRHRLDGPALEWASGSKEWWVDGQPHRTDGPASIMANGTKAWYVDGKCHRLDGPAIVCGDGTQEWHVHGKRHRLDGPAVERASGLNEWWIDGKQLIPAEISEQIKLLRRRQERVTHQERMKRLDRLASAKPRRKP